MGGCVGIRLRLAGREPEMPLRPARLNGAGGRDGRPTGRPPAVEEANKHGFKLRKRTSTTAAAAAALGPGVLAGRHLPGGAGRVGHSEASRRLPESLRRRVQVSEVLYRVPSS